MTALPPEFDVPGLREALASVDELRELVRSAWGAAEPTAEQVTVAVMAASRPHVQAELLADLADEFAEAAPAFAHMLDQISHDMRTEVARW